MSFLNELEDDMTRMAKLFLDNAYAKRTEMHSKKQTLHTYFTQDISEVDSTSQENESESADTPAVEDITDLLPTGLHFLTKINNTLQCTNCEYIRHKVETFRDWSVDLPAGNYSASIPHCHCNNPAARLITKKEGPNHLRPFYNCSLRKCNYFCWEDTLVDTSSVLNLNNLMIEVRITMHKLNFINCIIFLTFSM